MSIEYNQLGVLGRPSPSLCSTITVSCSNNEPLTNLIRQDILSVVKYIENERLILKRYLSTSLQLARTMSEPSKTVLHGIKHRLNEVQIILDIQDIKRHSVKYNNDLKRLYVNSNCTSVQSSKHMMQPEHFMRLNTALNRKQMQKYDDQRSSPWDGSDYKHNLVVSLRNKLLLKIIFNVFVHNRNINLNNRQCILSAQRSRFRTLMQLCFTSILFESLSSRYIRAASEMKCKLYMITKYSKPAYFRLLRAIKRENMNKYNAKRASLFRSKADLTKGVRLLQWNTAYNSKHRALALWSCNHSQRMNKTKAFMAWIFAFVQKHKMRREITARFSASMKNDVNRGRGVVEIPPLLTSTASTIQEYCSAISALSIASIGTARKALRKGGDTALSMLFVRPTPVHTKSPVQPKSPCINYTPVLRNLYNNVSTRSNKYYVNQRDRCGSGDSNSGSDDSLTMSTVLPYNLCVQLKQSLYAKEVLPAVRFENRSDVGNSSPNSLLSSIVNEVDDACEEDYRLAVNDGTYSLLESHSSRINNLSSNSNSSFHCDNAINVSSTTNKSVLEHALQMSENAINTSGSSYYQSKSSTKMSINISFCGEVSDSESDGSDGRRQSVTKSPSQRREFIQQTRAQFQTIKFNWIIKMTRRFVRNLRRQTRIVKAYRLTQRMCVKNRKRKTYNKWQDLFSKYQQKLAICDSIYNVQFSRKVLVCWYGYSVLRLQNARSAVIEMKLRRTQALTFYSWISLYKLRLLQMKATTKLHRRVKRTVWTQWQHYLTRQRSLLRFFQDSKNARNRVVFMRWRELYRRRILLRRVFTIHDIAWAHRNYHNTHHFHLLNTVFGAWARYSGDRVRMAREDEIVRKALCFRGVTLVVRYYYAWVDSTRQVHKVKQFTTKRCKAFVKRIFSAWRKAIKSTERKVTVADKWYAAQLKRNAIRGWLNSVFVNTVMAPVQYRESCLLRVCFDEWRVMRRERVLTEQMFPLWQSRRLFISFSEWKSLLSRRCRYRLGFLRVKQHFNRQQVKRAFYRWPGRVECLKSRQMSQYVMRKGRNRIRLVDVKDGTAETKGDESSDGLFMKNIRSFVAKVRPSIIERGIEKGYIYSMHDTENIAHIRTLLITVLNVWRDYLIAVKHYYRLTMKLRSITNKHRLTKSLRHWITNTPMTACRVVTWIHKRNARLHDDYMYLKTLKAESNAYQASRREIEKKLGV